MVTAKFRSVITCVSSLPLCSCLWLATGLKNCLDMVVSVVSICLRRILQSAVNNSCTGFSLRKIMIAKYELYSSQFILT